jgi:GNAT superfamily N-acetyltransferase
MAFMEAWPSRRLTDLADIWNDAAPGEPLVEDELEACWRDGSSVIGGADGAVVAHHDQGVTFVDLLAVRPGARRRGVGTALVTAAIEAFDADVVQWGGSVPWYLWPGVDATAIEVLALAESMGFENRAPAIMNLNVDPRWQVGLTPSPDAGVHRAVPEASAPLLDALAAEHPGWVDEVTRGLDHGTVHVVVDSDGAPLGLGAHSVNRLGWVGPMVTFGHARGKGVGTVALAAVCADLASAGYATCEIAWVGPVRFYAKVAGATAGRTFLPLSKTLRRASGS